MQWITPTVTDLNDARAAPLIAAARTTVLASGQPDPTTNLIARVVEEIRGMIGFSGKYQISTTANTIPPNLKPDAVGAIVRACIKRLNPAMFTEADRQDESTYQSRLNLIRQGQYPIDAPDDPLATNPSTPTGRVELIAGVTRRYTTVGLRNL